jgi:hypothetical protein
MEKSSQIAWKIVPLRHYFPLKVVPLIEILLYPGTSPRIPNRFRRSYYIPPGTTLDMQVGPNGKLGREI